MKRLVFASLAIVASSIIGVNFAGAQELNDERKASVSQTCVNAQSNLQRLGSSDTTTRINRGRDYDQVLKLFYLMNTRVASNDIAEPKLAEITKSFEEELTRFRENYNSYNEKLRGTIDFGCVTDPQGFYNSLDETRAKRADLNSNVVTLDSLIENYQTAIKELVI